MKIKYIITVLLITLFYSCAKEDSSLFDKLPDERLQERLEEYYSLLTEAESGWIMTLETKQGEVYRLWIDFKEQNRVDMLCDMDVTWNTANPTSIEIRESSYRVKGAQAPILIFDTYNYIHLMADPQGSNSNYGNINGGVNGEGLESDFEFTIGESNDNRVELLGRYNSSEAFLQKATAQEKSAIVAGALSGVHTNLSDYLNEIDFPVLEINENLIDVVIGSRETSFTYIADDQLITKKVSSFLDLSSATGEQDVSNLIFMSPLEVNGVLLTGLSVDGDGFYVIDNGVKKHLYDNRKPAIPLRFGYGLDYTKMVIDHRSMGGTIKDPFWTNVYDEALAKFRTSSGREIQYITFSFEAHPTSGEPIMRFTVRYNNTAGSNYNANWLYFYEFDEESGEITFTNREQTGSTNEAGREPYMRMLVDYFCTVTYTTYNTSSWSNTVVNEVTPVTFKIDWAENNTPGLTEKIGAFYLVSDPTSYCPGMLSK